MPSIEISTAAEMIAALHPTLSGDLTFLQGVSRALADIGSTDERRVLAYAEGFRAGQAAQAEAQADDASDAQAEAHAIRQAERERIGAIMGLAEAKGREASAIHLATTTDMDAAAIASALRTVPAAQPEPAMPAPRKPTGPTIRPDALRAKDAPGGLVAFDPETGQAAGAATVSFAPSNPLEGSGPAKRDAKSVWSGVVGKLNAGENSDATVR